jgi:hypothetical protein
LPQFKLCDQIRIFPILALFQFGTGFAAFRILGNQRTAIAGFVYLIFPIKVANRPRFVFVRVFFPDQRRKFLAD